METSSEFNVLCFNNVCVFSSRVEWSFFQFNVPLTTGSWRRDLGLKCHPKDWYLAVTLQLLKKGVVSDADKMP